MWPFFNIPYDTYDRFDCINAFLTIIHLFIVYQTLKICIQETLIIISVLYANKCDGFQ
jgi:hypothetical protein